MVIDDETFYVWWYWAMGVVVFGFGAISNRRMRRTDVPDPQRVLDAPVGSLHELASGFAGPDQSSAVADSRWRSHSSPTSPADSLGAERQPQEQTKT